MPTTTKSLTPMSVLFARYALAIPSAVVLSIAIQLVEHYYPAKGDTVPEPMLPQWILPETKPDKDGNAKVWIYTSQPSNLEKSVAPQLTRLEDLVPGDKTHQERLQAVIGILQHQSAASSIKTITVISCLDAKVAANGSCQNPKNQTTVTARPVLPHKPDSGQAKPAGLQVPADRLNWTVGIDEP